VNRRLLKFPNLIRQALPKYCSISMSTAQYDLVAQREREARWEEEERAAMAGGPAKPDAGNKFLRCGVCVVVLLGAVAVGAYFYLVNLMTGMAIDGFITLKEEHVKEYCGKDYEDLGIGDITHRIWWPGCGKDFAPLTKMEDFEKQCPKDGCIKPQTMKEMDDFNEKYGGRKVSYKSRNGKGEDGKALEQVTLSGWWMPAPNHNKDTPRIVVQHGFTSNSNKFRQQFLAWQLRKMGFSVLVNNFRDHCYSDRSKAHTVEWGHAYPYDLLGAWDYAKADSDGVMGGSLPSEKVGIMGISMGAFTTANAFGIDGDVPAVWIDGPPRSPKVGFIMGAEK